jgi:hypothetical protein
MYESKRILVVVKTYPNPSQTYGETVCCAGVDLATRRWVRMYPITFRRLADRSFAKFQEIVCNATRPRDDSRPESLRVDQDSIALVGRKLPAGDRGWRRRMASLPPAWRSLEEIREAQRAQGTSLAMFRPGRIVGFVKEKAKPWSARQRAYLRQEHLNLGVEISRELRELEQIPWTFSYRFLCDDERCTKPHELQVIDWEIGESYRKWCKAYGAVWEEKFRQKYEVDLPATDLHFVVGNLAKRRQTFVIIGLVRPPRPKMDGGNIQQTLDLMSEERSVTGQGIGFEAKQADSLGSDEPEEPLELFPDES